jgi:hypothetical protein
MTVTTRSLSTLVCFAGWSFAATRATLTFPLKTGPVYGEKVNYPTDLGSGREVGLYIQMCFRQ